MLWDHHPMVEQQYGFHSQTVYWLVVLTMLKNISQWEGLPHILWKNV
jgi:hypothetical protein